MTSSKISKRLCRAVTSRSPFRNGPRTGTCPQCPPVGSRMTQPICASPRRVRSTASRSLGGMMTVLRATSAGTPGTAASWGASAPGMRKSCQPWKWPANLRTRGWPVKMRANRRAISVASVPDDTKRTRSTDWHQSLNPLAPFDLALVAGAGVRRLLHLSLHRLDHGGMTVAQQDRAVAGPEIDQLSALDGPLVAAQSAVDVHRERLQMAQIVRDAVGEDGAGLLVQHPRAREGRRVTLGQRGTRQRGLRHRRSSARFWPAGSRKHPECRKHSGAHATPLAGDMCHVSTSS